MLLWTCMMARPSCSSEGPGQRASAWNHVLSAQAVSGTGLPSRVRSSCRCWRTLNVAWQHVVAAVAHLSLHPRAESFDPRHMLDGMQTVKAPAK